MSDAPAMVELDRTVRRERGRLVASLVHRLGPTHLELAEDVAQDAIMSALATWPYRGVPDKPGAWLSTVARNKAFDRLRRSRREEPWADRDEADTETCGDVLFSATVEDPELRLILLCCQDDLSEIEQLTLTLKLVGGFTAREIGQALLSGEAAIGQRLSRTRRKLQAKGAASADPPSRFGIAERVDTTLKVVYLMFSVGYAPRSGEDLLRREVLLEALRISRELAWNSITATADAKALAALLCFQASRLDARQGRDGQLILLADQDRGDWDRELIDEGMAWLTAAQSATRLSRYHVEAGIASLYATAPSWQQCDWASITALYEQLRAMTDSPVVTINASVAEAMAGDPAAALERLRAIADDKVVADYSPYHLALAETHRLLGDETAAKTCYERALECGVAVPVQAHIEERLASCL